MITATQHLLTHHRGPGITPDLRLIQRDTGGWDIALTLDGGYRNQRSAEAMLGYWRSVLAEALTEQGLRP